MRRKYAGILLALLLCLSFGSCSEKEAVAATEQVFQTSDGAFRITAPLDWKDVTDETDEASVLSLQKNSVTYAALAVNDAAGSLREYTEMVGGELKRGMKTKGTVTASEPEPFETSRYQGFKLVVRNQVEDVELCSNVYCLEAEERFIQLNCVYVNSIQPEMSQEYDAMVQTLAAVK